MHDEARPHGRARLVFPLDYATLDAARASACAVADSIGVIKIGIELFTHAGPEAIALGAESKRPVFLDLKLHDIPETVERAVTAAASRGVRYLTVHASGGAAMLERAARAAERAERRMTLLAVTVLTSLDARDLAALGVAAAPEDHAVRLAKLAYDVGVRGFVCSAAEVARLRHELGREALLVTPGIRPAGGDVGDQKRVATPARAIRDGADLLVVGRPIRDAIDPLAAARAVVAEIEAAEQGAA